MSAEPTTATAALSIGELRRRQVRSASIKAVLKTLLKTTLIGLSTFAIVLILWLAILKFGNVTAFVAKGPLDVYDYLVTNGLAERNRQGLVLRLGVTLRHSAIGFVAGLAVAIVGAIVFRVSKGAESALMPIATLLRSVPLIALAPVIILIFGFGTDISVAVIGGIVVLFPALVTIAFGLKSASPEMLDVVSVYGGSTFTAVRKVALPGALPSLFAAIRVSVPGAITGALLAEMLSTGDGLGRASVEYIAQAKFSAVWTSVVVITAISLLIYTVVQVIESVVLTRMGMNSDRRDN